MAVNLNPSPFDHFPDEAMLNLFTYFKRSEIPALAQVCTQWVRLAGDVALWEKEYRIVGLLKERELSIEELFEKKDPSELQPSRSENHGSLKALSERVNVLKQQVLATLPLSKIKVKTTREFDALWETNKLTPELMTEYRERLQSTNALDEGFKAGCTLCKLGVSPIAFLEQYLQDMETNGYTVSGNWDQIAHLYLSENQIDKAITIVETRFKGSSYSWGIIRPIVLAYCHTKKTLEALELIKKYKVGKDVDEVSLRKLIHTLHETKEFALLETVIDELVGKISKPFEILNLMEAYEHDNQPSKACEYFIKHLELLSMCDKFLLQQLLPLLISLKLEDQAWKLAEKRVATAPLVYYVLRNTYLGYGNQAMADKAIALIPPEKPVVSPPLNPPSRPNDFDDLDIDLVIARARARFAAENFVPAHLSNEETDDSDDDFLNELQKN